MMTGTTPTYPERSGWDQDDRDTQKQADGLQSALDWKREKGMLPKPSVSSAKKAAAPANDNEG
jgi:hypothetical protein